MSMDKKNEKWHLSEARAAKAKLKSGKKLSHAEQKLLKSHKEGHTKEALRLRAKQDRKKGVKKQSGIAGAVDSGVKEGTLAERSKGRRRKLDKAIDG